MSFKQRRLISTTVSNELQLSIMNDVVFMYQGKEQRYQLDSLKASNINTNITSSVFDLDVDNIWSNSDFHCLFDFETSSTIISYFLLCSCHMPM